MTSPTPAASSSSSSSPSSLVSHIKSTKVSSTLNDSREYAKQNLFDGQSETCWNSAQGTPQWIQISFLTPVTLASLLLTFQGGFVGRSMSVAVTTLSSPKKFLPLHTYEPKDVNQEQKFDVPANKIQEEEMKGVTNLKITFPSSTDFYGRITLYKLDLMGSVCETTKAAEVTTTEAATTASPKTESSAK